MRATILSLPHKPSLLVASTSIVDLRHHWQPVVAAARLAGIVPERSVVVSAVGADSVGVVAAMSEVATPFATSVVATPVVAPVAVN